MPNFISRWIENRKPCQFCGEVIRDGERRRVVSNRTWADFYHPKERYRFHKCCLHDALGSENFRIIDWALDVIRCIQYEAESKREKLQWQQMKLDMAKEASEQLESDLQELYG